MEEGCKNFMKWTKFHKFIQVLVMILLTKVFYKMIQRKTERQTDSQSDKCIIHTNILMNKYSDLSGKMVMKSK